jgi:formylglycine-generating enzyme required for sulfatase activity
VTGRAVFLSYSSNDLAAATALHDYLARRGLSVFFDKTGVHAGDRWLDRLQAAVDGSGAFVVLVGRDGVARWVGAETQAALDRHFGARGDGDRLPIFPVLIDGIGADALPAFLRLFQATAWDGASPPDEPLLAAIRDRTLLKTEANPLKGPPFVGLAAFRTDQAHLFFGRQQETLAALACFDTRPGHTAIRWLEINGTSGSGKSSLMLAGLLPLIDQGWLWPRTGVARWQRIGPMLPGARPMEMLAESLARAFKDAHMADLIDELALGDGRLRYWLRERKADDTAFLLAIDQFEELLTFAEAEERRRSDRLLAAAVADPDCPLFVLSTVRADFLDRFGEDMPELTRVLNHVGKRWTLAPIGEAGLREVIDGPARLASLDVDEVREAIIDQARDEPGALPLVENALDWLWQQREKGRLSGRLFTAQGGLAGLLSRSADDLLDGLGPPRSRAMELLFRLVKVDPEGVRHARQRIGRDEALAIAGGGAAGLAVVNRLSGQRRPDGGRQAGPLRLITIGDNGAVNLIHETLIRSKGLDAAGKPQPYWPTLWDYIEQHKEQAAWRERLRLDMQTWLENGKAPGFQWSHERVRELHKMVQKPGPRFDLDAGEREFLGPIDADAMLAELERPETTHKRRLLIGERLAVLGDPRPGVRVDERGAPQIDWHPAKGGEATISILSDPSNPNSEVKERTRKRVGSFQIARYPVTVSQYRAFLDAADGWCDQGWWGNDLYRDPDGTTYEFGRFDNHPVVYVSWFDAVAFCRWLGQRVGLDIRLPDEWQWQLAATGGDDRNVFPWGADWEVNQEPWRANTFESRLGQLTAVGMYPAGAAPTGALDMAGQVWEWCLTKFDRPEDSGSRAEDFDYRALRGGSWSGGRGIARSANRFRYDPNFRNNLIGFRVMCVAPL